MAVEYWFDSKAYFDNKLATMKGWDALTLIAAFKNAGYDNTPEGMFQHFLDYGNAEGISPNGWFNSQEYLYNKAVNFFGRTNVTTDQIKSMQLAMADGGMSPWDHFNKYWAESFGDTDPKTNDFLNPSAKFDVGAYMAAKLKAMNDAGDPITLAELVKAFVDNGLNPLEHYLLYGQAEGLVPVPVGGGIPGNAIMLASGAESLYGTTGADYFYAKLGTLDDNDYIDGHGGNDTLYANISAGPAISPEIINVETILFRTQFSASGGGDNLTQGNIDAEFIFLPKGQKLTLGSDNSRATLIIEDIRHLSNETAIRFSNTDPGVSFNAYFNDQWLSDDGTNTTGKMKIELMDVKNGQLINKPLYDNPFDTFTFQYTDNAGNTKMIKLALPNIKGDATYQDLLNAFNTALDASEVAGIVTAKLDGTFLGQASVGGVSYSKLGELLWLEANTGSVAAKDAQDKPIPDAGWGVSTGVVPPTGGIVWDASNSSTTTCPLLTTKIELDNVGHLRWDDNNDTCLPDNSMFGSQAGEMVVGIMGGRGGLERFDVTVDASSWLSSLSSTNNTLRMVKVVNGIINGTADGGHLFIGKSLLADGGIDLSAGELVNWMNLPRLLSTDGLTDVKYFTSTEMLGNVNIGAQLTWASYDKYLKDVDGIIDMEGNYAPNGPFKYHFGVGNDTLNMEVNAGIAADRDFKLDIKMGEGNDLVNFKFMNLTGSRELNQIALKNVDIDLGGGNDAAWFWGNGAVNVSDGAGADRLYLGQNTDQNAVFVLGANSIAHTFIKAGPDGAQPLENEVVALNPYGLTFNNAVVATSVVTMTITFAGLEKEVEIKLTAGQENITTDALNKLIITAINEDPRLGALLFARDGMGQSLIVESLIDGFYEAGNDFTVDFAITGGGAFTGDGIYGATDNVDQAVSGADALDSALRVVTEGGGGKELQHMNIYEALTDDFYTIVYNGVSYTTATKLGANKTLTELAALLADAVDSGGIELNTIVTVTVPANTDYLKLESVANLNVSNDTVIVTGKPGLVTGSDQGTYSHNTVTMGAGNDVIALNVNSGTNAFDTLVIKGEFGNDVVMGFNKGYDKLDFGSFGAKGVTFDTASTVDLANALKGIGGLTVVEGKNIVVVQNAGGTGNYWVFEVTSTDTSINTGDTITVLGTIDTGADGTIVSTDIIPVV